MTSIYCPQLCRLEVHSQGTNDPHLVKAAFQPTDGHLLLVLSSSSCMIYVRTRMFVCVSVDMNVDMLMPQHGQGQPQLAFQLV